MIFVDGLFFFKMRILDNEIEQGKQKFGDAKVKNRLIRFSVEINLKFSFCAPSCGGKIYLYSSALLKREI